VKPLHTFHSKRIRLAAVCAAALLAIGARNGSADDKGTGQAGNVPKRQVPVILTPKEFATATVRAQLPALQFVSEDGKITKVWVLKSGAGAGMAPANIGGNLQGLLRGGVRMGQVFPQRKEDQAKLEVVVLDKAEGRTPATQILPLRMVIVTASFPYKQQVEEFRKKLHLPDHGAVLAERVQGDKDQTWPSFQFHGLEVERMTLNPDGNGKGKWELLDFAASYVPLVIQTYRQFEAEDPELQPILQASRGLMMRLPRQYRKGEYPRPEANLRRLQNTIRKLQKIGKTDRVPRVPTESEFDPFTPPAKTLAVKAPAPQPKETPIDHCLIRFLDVDIEPGKAYRYRFKVKMMNPNYAPRPEQRKDTLPRFAKEKELQSAWAVVPGPVVVPPDQFVYAVDQKNIEPKVKSPLEPTPNQAVFQIHRWVDFHRPPGAIHNQPVGDWLVAARFFVDRGDYVRTRNYRVQVPIKNLYHVKPELDSIPGPRPNEKTTWIPVPFGDDSILIDFEGGRSTYQKGKVPVEDRTATEVLIMRPDGKMIARNNFTDQRDPTRVERLKKILDRIRTIKKGEREEVNPFDR
jgi:hypothetical protein